LVGCSEAFQTCKCTNDERPKRLIYLLISPIMLDIHDDLPITLDHANFPAIANLTGFLLSPVFLIYPTFLFPPIISFIPRSFRPRTHTMAITGPQPESKPRPVIADNQPRDGGVYRPRTGGDPGDQQPRDGGTFNNGHCMMF
jgi:hypothetical protein